MVRIIKFIFQMISLGIGLLRWSYDARFREYKIAGHILDGLRSQIPELIENAKWIKALHSKDRESFREGQKEFFNSREDNYKKLKSYGYEDLEEYFDDPPLEGSLGGIVGELIKQLTPTGEPEPWQELIEECDGEIEAAEKVLGQLDKMEDILITTTAKRESEVIALFEDNDCSLLLNMTDHGLKLEKGLVDYYLNT